MHLRDASFLLLSCALVAQQQPTAHEPRVDQDPDLLAASRRELAAVRAELAQLREASRVPPPVTGTLGVDCTSQYFFRGILQENQGVIGQPWIELGYRLYEGQGPLREVGLTFGSWNSLHDGPSGGAGGVWYESDFYARLAGRLGERWTLGTTYTAYHSPNTSFETVQELAVTVNFDDQGLLFACGLSPSVLIAWELAGAGQADAGAHPGTYLQFGIEPSLDLGRVDGLDLRLKLPVKLGLSLGDYYESSASGRDETFGYGDLGAVVVSALPSSERLGAWEMALGCHFTFLGDSNEERNAGDPTEVYWTFGLSTRF